jgi:hypothetical protein
MNSIDAYASTDCDRQSSSSVDCQLSSEESENNNDDDDSGNIEDQIPSVIPFP